MLRRLGSLRIATRITVALLLPVIGMLLVAG